MASSPAPKSHGGSDARRTAEVKCKWCRERRRLHCVKPPGASKCVRCESLGLLCVTPISPGFQESHQVKLTPGEYCREILRPTTLNKTRLAVAQLTEDLSELHLAGGQLPDQVLGVIGIVMRRARAANNLALLHSAVSLNAALHLNSSMSSLVEADVPVASQRQRFESLVAEGEEYIAQRRALDGVQQDGLAQVRQVMHSGVSKVTCNELFKSAFFGVADKEIKALYHDLSVALVDDESKEDLKALDEKVARQAMLQVVPKSPSGLCLFATTSDTPLVLVGRTGERLTATMRVDAAWPADGSVTTAYVSLIGLRTAELAESGGSPRQAAAASTGQEDGGRQPQSGHSEQSDGHEHSQHEGIYESWTTPSSLMFPEVIAESNAEGVPDIGGDDGDDSIELLCSALLSEGEAAVRESR